MKRFTAFLLCAALCLSPALAVGEEKFPAVNVYPGYADVKETDWFYDTAKLCYEIGLMTGTDRPSPAPSAPPWPPGCGRS